MSSFASRAREEIAQRSIQKDCCVRAAAYGIACFAKYFDAKGSGGADRAAGDGAGGPAAVCPLRRAGRDSCTSSDPAACCMNSTFARRSRWRGCTSFSAPRAVKPVCRSIPALSAARPASVRTLAQLFCAVERSIDPQKEYNLEFLTSRTNLARDFEALLAEHEFAPHRTRRNGVNLIYVKTGANVERLLSFMGAGNAAEEMHAQKSLQTGAQPDQPTDQL